MRFSEDAKTQPFQRNLKPVPLFGVLGSSLYKGLQNPERK